MYQSGKNMELVGSLRARFTFGLLRKVRVDPLLPWFISSARATRRHLTEDELVFSTRF